MNTPVRYRFKIPHSHELAQKQGERDESVRPSNPDVPLPMDWWVERGFIWGDNGVPESWVMECHIFNGSDVKDFWFNAYDVEEIRDNWLT